MSLVAYAIIAALSGQDPTVSEDCLDDNLTDRCDAGQRAETLARLAAPSIEQDAESGAEVYRVLAVDGYGLDLPVIAFERRPGVGPQAVVYVGPGLKLATPVGQDLWSRVQRETRLADQEVVAARPEGSEGQLNICLHSWVMTLEMANSYLDRSHQVPVRRRTEDACSNGLTTQTTLVLADLAMDAFAQCKVLEETHYRSAFQRLGACAGLSGDVPAAAEVKNHLSRVERQVWREGSSVDFWHQYIGMNAAPTVSWDGETIVGRLHGRELPEFIAARTTANGVRLALETISGVNAREVLVTGVLVSRADDAAGAVGVYTQTWEFSPPGRNWVLKSMTVTMNAEAS